jgi:hypothetical protein
LAALGHLALGQQLARLALGTEANLARLSLGFGVLCLPRVNLEGSRLVADPHLVDLVGRRESGLSTEAKANAPAAKQVGYRPPLEALFARGLRE